VPGGHPSLQPGSLTRTFSFVYVNNKSTIAGPVRTPVHQEQVLRLLDDDRLQLRITQTMPNLPQGETAHVPMQLEACCNVACKQFARVRAPLATLFQLAGMYVSYDVP
jgi:hypothetical protein